MVEHGYLIRTERGIRTAMDFQGDTIHFDATNPAAQKYVWEEAKKNYYSKGMHFPDLGPSPLPVITCTQFPRYLRCSF